MSIDRKFPLNVDPRMKSILEAIYGAIDELQRRPSSVVLSAADRLALVEQTANRTVGLLGPFGTPVLGQGSDPLLQNVGSGNGTVTSITFNSAFGGGTITGSGTVTLVIGTNNTIQKSDGTKLVNSRITDDGNDIALNSNKKVFLGVTHIMTIDDANGFVLLNMATLPVADPGVSGALWNNAGVINVSP